MEVNEAAQLKAKLMKKKPILPELSENSVQKIQKEANKAVANQLIKK